MLDVLFSSSCQSRQQPVRAASAMEVIKNGNQLIVSDRQRIEDRFS